jgi:hypothetical protein
MDQAVANTWSAWACILWSVAFAICTFSVAGFIAILRTTNKNYVPKHRRY